MKHVILVIVWLVTLSSTAAEIRFPKQVPSGSLVEISVEQSINETVIVTPAFLERATGVLESWTQSVLPWRQYDHQQHRYVVLSSGIGNRSLTLTATTATTDSESRVSYSAQVVRIEVSDTPGPKPPPGPDPDPQPDPTPKPLPDDEFDNLGRALQAFAGRLTQDDKRKATLTALAYSDAADRLLKLPPDGFLSATQSQAWLQAKRTEIWQGSENEELKRFVAILQTPWSKRWPMEKSKVVEFYRVVAKGLGS